MQQADQVTAILTEKVEVTPEKHGATLQMSFILTGLHSSRYGRSTSPLLVTFLFCMIIISHVGLM